MSRKSAHHARLRAEHLPTIKEFCEDAGLKYEFIHGYEWHIRIECVLDVFPTSNRYHWIKTGGRGSFRDYEELGQIFERHINDK